MDNHASFSKGYQQLRWKQILGYLTINVCAMLPLELVLLGVSSFLLVRLLNGGFLPDRLFETDSSSYTLTLRFDLAPTS